MQDKEMKKRVHGIFSGLGCSLWEICLKSYITIQNIKYSNLNGAEYNKATFTAVFLSTAIEKKWKNQYAAEGQI